MSRNLYILITPPGQSNANFLEAMGKGKKGNVSAHQIAHARWNLDHTKVIVQAEFTDAEIQWFSSKPWAQLIGTYENGITSQSVYDYLNANLSEWESPEG